MNRPIAYVLVASLALAACKSNPPKSEEPPAPAARSIAAPAAKPAVAKPAEAPPSPVKAADATVAATPAKRAEIRLDGGVKAYEDGDYKTAQQELQGALDQGLTAKSDQVKASKYLAFVACATQKRDSCKTHFLRALALNPKFELTKAEAGHPVWGPVFRDAKKEAAAKAQQTTAPARTPAKPAVQAAAKPAAPTPAKAPAKPARSGAGSAAPQPSAFGGDGPAD